MNIHTYYIVQFDSTTFVHDDPVTGFAAGRGADKAAHLNLATARKLYKELCAKRRRDTPRRFPRIIKVSVEMKTITAIH